MPDAPDTRSALPVAVVGAGVIGTSVAYACAAAGHQVVLIDQADKDWEEVDRALRRQHRLALVAGQGAPEPRARIEYSADLADAAHARVVVENVVEDPEVKRQVHRGLAAVAAGDAFIAANTSAIPIAQLAAHAADPASVAGAHFMNPVPAIDTVEVVRGPQTSEATLRVLAGFLEGLGKRGVVVNDAPGFVVNRILMMMVNQAAELVGDGVAGPADIDLLFKGCLGHRMGPLRTADLIGLDTVVRTLEVLHDAGPGFAPAAPLRALVDAGRLGMKTGEGFYRYGAGSRDG